MGRHEQSRQPQGNAGRNGAPRRKDTQDGAFGRAVQEARCCHHTDDGCRTEQSAGGGTDGINVAGSPHHTVAGAHVHAETHGRVRPVKHFRPVLPGTGQEEQRTDGRTGDHGLPDRTALQGHASEASGGATHVSAQQPGVQRGGDGEDDRRLLCPGPQRTEGCHGHEDWQHLRQHT